MVRITSIEGYWWPLSIECDCGITFEVDSPTDFSVKEDFEFKQVDGGLQEPECSNITYFVKCPICGKEHKVDEAEIPSIIRSKIPKVRANFS